MENEALRQIGNGLNNLHAAMLASQKASERRHSFLEQRLDERFDALYKRLDEVCDKGGEDHKEFRDAIVNLDTRMRVQEARQLGRADIWKPMVGWATKNWPIVLLVLYIGWDQVGRPLVADAVASPANVVRLQGAL